MCGITGLFGINDKAVISKMNDSIKHRGPDDYGYFFGENISLGSRRLSVIDLKTGKQPIFNENNSIVIVFNGEIYNFKALREMLKGHEFRTKTDTEAIVHLYEEFGLDFVTYLEGMFAFAIYDIPKKKLILARDYVGEKPLFYCQTKETLLFASEMKALFASGLIKAEFDEQAIKENFIFDKYILDDRTFFKGIKSLLPGTMLITDSTGKLSFKQFIKKDYSITERNENHIKEKLRSLMSESVDSMLISDVTLGTQLSGGIDSSIIAALHRQILGKDAEIHTFTAIDTIESEESRMAKLVANEINSIHHEFEFGAEDIVKELPSFVYHLEDIRYGIVYPYFLNKGTKKYATVALSGQGADELFCGYEIFQKIEEYKKQLLEKVKIAQVDDPERYLEMINSIKKEVDLLQFEQTRGQLSNFQLAFVDRLSMAFGVEVRVPFMHRKIVDYANKIDPALKIRNGEEKYMLRKAFSGLGLPKAIISRKKVAAGLANTSPKSMPEFESYCEKLVKGSKQGKYDIYFKNNPAKKVCFDLLKEIFVERNAVKPVNFSLTELY
ncbi:MAG: asparagine synthase (glutamine-hydrolyzing) [archaeon]